MERWRSAPRRPANLRCLALALQGVGGAGVLATLIHRQHCVTIQYRHVDVDGNGRQEQRHRPLHLVFLWGPCESFAPSRESRDVRVVRHQGQHHFRQRRLAGGAGRPGQYHQWLVQLARYRDQVAHYFQSRPLSPTLQAPESDVNTDMLFP